MKARPLPCRDRGWDLMADRMFQILNHSHNRSTNGEGLEGFDSRFLQLPNPLRAITAQAVLRATAVAMRSLACTQFTGGRGSSRPHWLSCQEMVRYAASRSG